MKGWGKHVFEKEEGTEAGNASIFPFVLPAFIFHLCAYVPQSRAQPQLFMAF